MTPSNTQSRFDELCVGHALGDLTPEEARELDGLCQQLGLTPDATFELLAATLEIDAVIASGETMPASFSARLHQWAEQPQKAESPTIIRPEIPAWRKFLGHRATGWAAAAALLMVILILPRKSQNTPATASLTPAQAEIRLRSEAKDLIERSFSGLGDFAKAGGKVIWSNARQEGYMILNGVVVNDPQKAQYQLWIVDPTRDADSPVDGGVFDIPTDGAPVVIPISAKLALSQPKAFVITLEQPGGVVKSKQEKVVALAKT